MTSSPLIEELLTALLRETTTQDLIEARQETIRSIVEALAGESEGNLRTTAQTSMEVSIGIDEMPNRQPDSALVEVLGNHVETAGVIVEILSMLSVSQNAFHALRCVELQLTALTIGVSDLRQALEQNSRPRLLHRWQRSLMALLRRIQFHQYSDKPLMKPRHIALCALMLLLPFGLKLGVPALLHQANRWGWLEKVHLDW